MAEGGKEVELQMEKLEDSDNIQLEELEYEETYFNEYDDSSIFRHFNTSINDDDINTSLQKKELGKERVRNFIKTIYENPKLSEIMVKEDRGFFYVRLKSRINAKFFLMSDNGVDKGASTALKNLLGEKNIDKLKKISEEESQIEYKKKI